MDDRTAEPLKSYDLDGLKRLLPHRDPFLMIDRLTDIRDGVSAIGWKSVNVSEPHFAGHFPGNPVMPGVLIVESLAQAGGALVVHTLGVDGARRQVYFMTIDKARFRKPVRPGDMLRLEVRVQRHRGPVWRFEGKAYVGEDLAAEAEYSAMIGPETQLPDGSKV